MYKCPNRGRKSGDRMSELEHLDLNAPREERLAFFERQIRRDRMALVNLDEETEEMRYMSECEKWGYTWGCDGCPVRERGECKYEVEE